jgi:hypothetical protein
MFIENATSGSQSIAISQGSGANVTIATGKTAVVYLDGAGSGAAVVDAMAGVDPGVTDTLAEVLTAGNTTGGTDLAVSTGDDITFADNSKAIFGAGSDLQIYHDGTNSYVKDAGTGYLILGSQDVGTSIQNSSGHNLLLTGASEVKIGYANAFKLATTASGISVTGDIVLGDSNPTITMNDSSVTDLQHLITSSSDRLIIAADNNDVSAGSKIEFYVDGTERMNIDSLGGITAASQAGGHVVFNSNTVDADFRVAYNNGTHALYVDGATGNVGIGTSSPRSLINASSATGAVLTLESSDTTLGENDVVGQIDFYANDASTNSTGNKAFIKAYSETAGGNKVGLDFATSSSDSATGVVAMTIDSSRNVGIGTSSPTGLLHLAAENAHVISKVMASTSGYDAELWLGRNDTRKAIIRAEQLSSNSEHDLVFFTNAASADATEKLRLGSNGAFAVKPTVGGHAVFNEDGVDADFRVESNGNANMLFIDANNNRVGIGTGAPSYEFVVSKDGSSGIEFGPEGIDSTTSFIQFYNRSNGAYDTARIYAKQLELYLEAAQVIGLQITTTEAVINQSGTAMDFRVESDTNDYALFLDANTNCVNIQTSGGVQSIAGLNARVNGAAIEFGHTNNSAGYFGTLGAQGNNGHPYLGFSTSAEFNENTFKTYGAAGNIIVGDLSGNLLFSQVVTASAVNQTPVERMRIQQGSLVINEPGNNYDFRVESNNNSNMFVVNGGVDKIGMGRSANLRDVVTITGANSDTSFATTTAALEITNSDNSVGHFSALNFRVAAGNYEESLATVSAKYSSYSGNVRGQLSFGTRGASTTNVSERMRIDEFGKVFCYGDVAITGALSKGSGSFKIDHPLPAKTETHNLVHSFIEGPQADNIYRGKVTLVDGSATVNIDTVSGMSEGTYVLLNTNTQCFTSNESGWTAVKGSVSGNILTITAQESCSDTISWMVVGERHDQHMLDTEWTDENGKVIVEPLKN